MHRILFFIFFIITNSSIYSQQPAFPSAYGAGANSLGGRGGKVCFVDTLTWDTAVVYDAATDSYSGGFYNMFYELDIPARQIVFTVSGVITVPSTTQLNMGGRGNITVNGQTAPGKIVFETTFLQMNNMHDVIFRYVSFAYTGNAAGSFGTEVDAIWLRATSGGRLEDIMIDHCSFFYGGDECLDISSQSGSGVINNVTVQNVLTAGASKGGMLGSDAGVSNNTWRNSAFVDCNYRYPNLIGWGTSRQDAYNNFVENPYNRWIRISGSGDFNIQNYYVQTNYFTGDNAGRHTVQYTDTAPCLIHSSGNFKTGEHETTTNPDFDDIWWTFLQSSAPYEWQDLIPNEIKVNSPMTQVGRAATIHDAVDVPTLVLPYVGNNKRLAADGSVINDSYAVDEYYLDLAMNPVSTNTTNRYPATRYPTVPGGTPYTDTDKDGMADAWEAATFGDLTKTGKADTDADGYTDLEEFLNGVDVDISGNSQVSAGGDINICEGTSATLTAIGSQSYVWDTGQTSSSIIVEPSQTTTYTVTGTDSEGNKSTDSVIVIVNALPNANAGSDEEVCENDSITLNASGGDSYEWSYGQTTQSITVSPNDTTTYTVTVTTNGCSDTDDVTVTVKPRPSVNAGNDVDINQTESITLTASGDGTFIWSTGEETQSITVSPIETTTYTVTANLNGCSSSDSVTVTVLEPDTVSANAGEDKSICENESVTLTASGGPNYLWNTGETTQSITVSPLVTTTYSVTVSNDFNSDTDEVTVTVNTLPTANAGSDEEICENDSITLNASGGDSYEWSNGQTTQSITVSPNNTSTYTVTVITNGCTATDDVVVTVKPRPSVNAGNDVDIYQSESITLTANGDGTFIWNTGEETQSIIVSPIETTTYSVTANLNGCSSSDSVTVTVLEPDTVNANAGEDKSICENESVTLTATGGPNYLWNTGETTQSITVSPTVTTTYSVTVSNDFNSDTDEVTVTVNPYPTASAGDDRAILSGDTMTLSASGGSEFIWSTGETTQEIVVEPQETTTYTVEVIENGCSDIASVTVVVGVSASVGGEPTICQGQSTTLYAAGGSYFLWSTGETSQSIEVSPTQTTTYSVVVSNNTSSDEAEITVNVNLVPEADAGEDVTIESGQNITLTASGGNSYLWSNGETTQSISVSPTDTTTYTVESIINGCSNSDDVKVSVVQQVNANAGEDMQICLGESTELTATGGLYFIWDTGVETASISVSPVATTVYSVTVSNGFSSQTAEVVVTVEDCQDIDNLPQNFESEFSVYPNPTDGQVNIRLSGIENVSSIYVSDLTGKVISKETFEANDGYVINKQYDFSSLSKGIYLITFKQIGEVAITKKLIVK